MRGRLFPVLGLSDKLQIVTNFGSDLEKPFKWTADAQAEKTTAGEGSQKTIEKLANGV